MKRLITTVLCAVISATSFAYTGKDGSLERTLHDSQLLMNKMNPLISKASVFEITDYACDQQYVNDLGEDAYNACLFVGKDISSVIAIDNYTLEIRLKDALKADYSIVPTNNSQFTVLSKDSNKFVIQYDSSVNDFNVSFNIFGELDQTQMAASQSNLNKKMGELEHLIRRFAKAVAKSQFTWATDTFLNNAEHLNQRFLIGYRYEANRFIDEIINQKDLNRNGMNNKMNYAIKQVNTSVNDLKNQLNSTVIVQTKSHSDALNSKASEVSANVIEQHRSNAESLITQTKEEILAQNSSGISIPPSNCGVNELPGNWNGTGFVCKPRYYALGTVDFQNGKLRSDFHENVTVQKKDLGLVKVTFKKPLISGYKVIAVPANTSGKDNGNYSCTTYNYTESSFEMASFRGRYRNSTSGCAFFVEARGFK